MSISDWITVLSVLEVPLFIVGFAISAFLLKKKLKRTMATKLGRNVEDRELVSISTWMNAPPSC